jgi:putative ABC transport system permease protein
VKWFSASRIALRALKVNKMRSALTMLGIIVGIAAVITTLAVGSGARSEVEEQVALLGTNLLIVVPGSQTAGGVRLGAGSRPSLTESDAHALQRELPDIEAAAPNLRGSGPMVYGPNNWLTSFHGSTPDFFVARNWPIASGRSFTEAELEGAAKVVLLGETVAQNLFGDADPIGQIVRVRRAPMEVIGVMGRKGQTLQGHDQDDMILVPITTARTRLFGGSQAKLHLINYISVKVREGADLMRAETDIRALLRQRHRLHTDAPDDFTIRNLTEVIKAREEATRAMTLLLSSVASISLIIGGVGIMNIMLVSVTERTREIGVRMALGARARDILSQFLVEAIALALAGGLCGVVAGVASSYALARLAEWQMNVDVNAIALALAFATSIGILFGFYPARKASQLSPIDALRSE